jgi:diphthine-ammonia ligase
MVASNLHAILIKVASIGLSPAKHVGKSLAEVRTTLHSLNAKYGVHVCGEGGEFESLVLDSVLYRKRIVIDESEIVMHSDDSFAPVGYLKVRSAHLEDKPRVDHSSDQARAVAALAAATAANPEHGNPGWVFDQSDVLGSGDTSAVIPADTAQLMPLLGLHRSNENDRTSSFWGLAGGCLDAATASKQMSPGDAAKIVLADVCQLLAKRGLKPEHVMQTHLYVANMATFAEINREYERVFRHNPPARVCVGCQLPPGQPLVMDAIVFVPAPVAGAAGAADFLHVQGRSHWAPANIGPYSQYGCASGQVMMAGQIGLVPATMKLRETTAQQAELSLNSALAVMIAAGTNPSGALACLCMVTSVDHVGLARAVFASFLQHHAAASAGRVLQVVVVDELPAAAKIEWHFVVAKDASGVAMSTMTQEDETGLEWHLSASASSGNGYVWTALTEAQVGQLASMSALGSMLGAAMAGPSGDATPEVYLARLYCAREAPRGKGADHIAALSQNLREQGAAVSVIPVAMLGGGAAVHIGCHFTWPVDPDGDE